MKDFLDRIPTQVGRRKITHADGTSEYVTVEMADEPSVEGTPLNRAAFMALQGFETKDTKFNADNSVTETNANGDILTTTFPTGAISLETFIGKDGQTISKRTVANSDGSISEVVL